jgi:hypothetical protein
MTNSHDTTVALPLLLDGIQPTSGSKDDTFMPQLSMPFSSVPSYQSTYLLAVTHFEPLVLVPVQRKAWLDNCNVHSLC